MPGPYQHAIVACARWESDYLVEWLIYHRQIGFDHVYLYCNDDNPMACYERLLSFTTGPSPFVSFVHFPFPGVQGLMYKDFLRRHIQDVGWFIFLDIDEFLVFRQDGSVGNFLAKRQERADMIFINWLIFGHSGYKERPPGSVLLQYTRRDRDVHHFTKVLTRARTLNAAHFIGSGETGFWHNWNFRRERLHRVINVIGDDVSGYYADAPKSARAYLDAGDRQERIIATAVIHHYQFRSEDELERRMRRGTGGDFRGQLAFKGVIDSNAVTSFLRPFSQVEDTTLHDYWCYVLDSACMTSIIARPTSPNIALGKPALQSSVSPWSREPTAEADAAGVVGGIFAGSYNCHTSEEDFPWWQVDLLGVHTIRQIQIFNRVDTEGFRDRSALFALETSLNGVGWTVLHQTRVPQAFGGADGEPLIWTSEKGMKARHFRFRLLARTLLHLDAVEIYETPMERIVVDPARYGPLTERIVGGA